MRAMLSWLCRFAEHPVTNLVIAVVLVISALVEGGEAFFEPLLQGEVGVHHGVLLFGIAQALKTLPDLVEGIERVAHGPETKG